MKTGEGNIIQE